MTTGVTGVADERTAYRLVGVVWALLVVNTLGASSPAALIPIPGRLGQLVTMGALVTAFSLALILNPRVRLRPSAFLLLLTLLVVLSFVSSSYLESGFGAIARCIRFALFIGTLWLLTPFWDGTVRFIRYHVLTLSAVLATVVVGMVVSPGTAFGNYEGRLSGALWYLESTQVGDYAAVVIGMTVLLWLGRCVDGRSAAIIVVPSVGVLLLTHTRTATFAMLVGLAIGVLSLAATNARARRAVAVGLLGVGVVGVMWKAVQTWVLRGQDADTFTSLTGRQAFWDAVLAKPRRMREELIGVGLTDKSFGGLPIDSSWLVVYQEQGFIGVGLVALLFVVLLVAALLHPTSPARACAILLILHCLLASYTQVGLSDASTYLLHLAAAAASLGGRGATVVGWRDGVRQKERDPAAVRLG